MKISVVIATRNRSRQLKRCLLGFQKQKILPDEIIIIDNGSKDDTRVVVKAYSEFLPLRYFFESKIGIPYARNQGLKQAKGDIIAFTDDDCIVCSTWVKEIKKAFKNMPLASAVLGKSIEKTRSIFNSVSEFLFKEGFFYAFLNRKTQELKFGEVVDTKNAAFLRKVLFKNRISFDERYARFGSGRCEDMDFGRVVKLARGRIYYWPQMLVFHFSLDNSLKILYKKFLTGRAINLLNQKDAYPIYTKGKKVKEMVKIVFRRRFSFLKKCLFCLGLFLLIFSFKLGFLYGQFIDGDNS